MEETEDIEIDLIQDELEVDKNCPICNEKLCDVGFFFCKNCHYSEEYVEYYRKIIAQVSQTN